MMSKGVFVVFIVQAIIPDSSSLGCDKQARFDTHQGRTVHVITAANSTGYDVIDYFSAVHNNRPFACNSFYRGSDDDSLLAAQCHLWSDGKWGSGTRINNWRLNDHAFYVPNKYHWVTISYVTCDSRIVVNNPGDYWKIYVR
ncbi:hypothetical protein AC249_AIPGENE3612 [Exaiptasia diaphana]|nr:hypothetical protein AC249_AIPGENE3612 [Exaiptasia diaphana]